LPAVALPAVPFVVIMLPISQAPSWQRKPSAGGGVTHPLVRQGPPPPFASSAGGSHSPF
jgi:hypothetical protein